MSVRADVLLWAQRVLGRKDSAPHQLLEIDIEASPDDARDAFHKAARLAHPDLHRTTLTPDELETVTAAYSRLAGAYQDFRMQRARTTRMPALSRLPEDLAGSTTVPLPTLRGVTVPERRAAAPTASSASAAMSSKALLYFRKAELSLRRGDLRGAALQLKLAIATDPQSAMLRTALGEVELELAKG